MKVIWAVLCERSVIDLETNQVSLFNIVEQVMVPAESPEVASGGTVEGRMGLASFELVTLWTRSDPDMPERGRGRLSLILPEDSPRLSPIPYEVDLTRHIRLRHRTRMPGLPVGGEGIFRFVIEGKSDSDDWAMMFELPLEVRVQTQGDV